MKAFLDFIPALAFLVALFIPETREEGVYLATKVIIITTFLQVLILWIITRRVEKQYLIILAVVLLLGSATLFFHDERFIKWKPTIVFWIFSLVCLASEYIGVKNITTRLLGNLFDAPAPVWKRANISLVIFLLLLGMINLYVAYHFDTEIWAFFKVFGIMALNVVFVIALFIYMFRYIIEPDNKKE